MEVLKEIIATLVKTLNYLRRELPDLPKDPYLMFSKSISLLSLLLTQDVVDDRENLDYIFSKIKALDLVGIYSSGYIYTGLANSLVNLIGIVTIHSVLIIRFIIKTIMQ